MTASEGRVGATTTVAGGGAFIRRQAEAEEATQRRPWEGAGTTQRPRLVALPRRSKSSRASSSSSSPSPPGEGESSMTRQSLRLSTTRPPRRPGEEEGGKETISDMAVSPSADVSGAVLLVLLTYLVQSPEVSVSFTCVLLLLRCLSVVSAIDDDVIINTVNFFQKGVCINVPWSCRPFPPPNSYSSILFSSLLSECGWEQ